MARPSVFDPILVKRGWFTWNQGPGLFDRDFLTGVALVVIVVTDSASGDDAHLYVTVGAVEAGAGDDAAEQVTVFVIEIATFEELASLAATLTDDDVVVVFDSVSGRTLEILEEGAGLDAAIVGPQAAEFGEGLDAFFDLNRSFAEDIRPGGKPYRKRQRMFRIRRVVDEPKPGTGGNRGRTSIGVTISVD